MEKEMTVNEVSKLTGVSIRTLHYYDEIGLLHPAVTTEAGYRLYDDTCLERLSEIMLFRELEFSLKDIKEIVENSAFDKKKALEDQIELLKMKREHIDKLIDFARKLKEKGDTKMNFDAFDTSKQEEYKKQAKEKWGNTKAYKEFEEKDKNYSDEDRNKMGNDLMDIFREFGEILNTDPAGQDAQKLVKKLQNFISAHYYTCTDEILKGLGPIYTAGDDMTKNIDAAGGKGCAEFVAKAISFYDSASL